MNGGWWFYWLPGGCRQNLPEHTYDKVVQSSFQCSSKILQPFVPLLNILDIKTILVMFTLCLDGGFCCVRYSKALAKIFDYF